MGWFYRQGDCACTAWLPCQPSEHIGIAGLEIGAGPVFIKLGTLHGSGPDGGFPRLCLGVMEPAGPGDFCGLPGRCRRQGGRRRQGTQGSNHGLRATRQAAVNHDGLGLQARDDPPAWWLTTVAHQPQGIKRRTTGGRVLLRMQQVAPAQIGGIFDEAGAGAGRVSLRLGSELIGATLPDGIETASLQNCSSAGCSRARRRQ